ncbi:MAG: cyclic nucleotide-binding domain-containing protein [Candidatus Hydrothermales bacterium]
MLENSYEKEFLEGEVIFSEGEKGDEIYLIKKGKVRIFKRFEESEKTLAILKEGDIFGEIAPLDGKPRSATAVALENTVVEVLDKESILNIINSHPIVKYLINTLAERLRKADEQIKLLTIKHEEQRFLTYLLIRYREGQKKEIDLNEIEYFTGIENDQLQSYIKDLESRGLISFKDNKLYILKEEEIEEYRKYIFLKEKFERNRKERT